MFIKITFWRINSLGRSTLLTGEKLTGDFQKKLKLPVRIFKKKIIIVKMIHLFTEHDISYINKTEKRKEVGRECKLV